MSLFETDPEKPHESENIPSKIKFSKKTKLLLIAGLALILVFAIGASTINKIDADRRSSATNYSTWLEELQTTVEPLVCDKVSEVIVNGKAIRLAKSIETNALKAQREQDIWTAESYVSKNAWVKNSVNLTNSYQNELTTVLMPVLEDRVANLKDDYASGGFLKSRTAWSIEFERFVLDNCSLKDASALAKQLVLRVESAADDISVKAANKPWYPIDFQVIPSHPDFAYKNFPTSCTYSFGSCAKFKIVSKYGCPKSLYVEANSIVNGEVVDWGNDSVRSLAPGRVAVMEASFTASSRGSWEFADITCY